MKQDKLSKILKDSYIEEDYDFDKEYQWNQIQERRNKKKRRGLFFIVFTLGLSIIGFYYQTFTNSKIENLSKRTAHSQEQQLSEKSSSNNELCLTYPQVQKNRNNAILSNALIKEIRIDKYSSAQNPNSPKSSIDKEALYTSLNSSDVNTEMEKSNHSILTDNTIAVDQDRKSDSVISNGNLKHDNTSVLNSIGGISSDSNQILKPEESLKLPAEEFFEPSTKKPVRKLNHKALFSLQAFSGINYPFSNNIHFISNKQYAKKSLENSTANLVVGWSVNNRFSLHTGIGLSQYNEKWSFRASNSQNTIIKDVVIARVEKLNGNIEDLKSDVPSVQTISQDYHFFQKYRVVSMPYLAGYHAHLCKQFYIDFLAGFTLNLNSKWTGNYINEEGEVTKFSLNSKMDWSALQQIGISYKRKNFGIGFVLQNSNRLNPELKFKNVPNNTMQAGLQFNYSIPVRQK